MVGEHLDYERREFFQGREVLGFSGDQVLDAAFPLALLNMRISMKLHDKATLGWQRWLIARYPQGPSWLSLENSGFSRLCCKAMEWLSDDTIHFHHSL